ncbi:hypothetical protein V1512DRAFT_209286 [Lipomyces arxii]|uniref:uncharacterized protein n=1 Tax=Lipomyces arxii TaxID=56418 RepID=UPI0034CD5BC5
MQRRQSASKVHDDDDVSEAVAPQAILRNSSHTASEGVVRPGRANDSKILQRRSDRRVKSQRPEIKRLSRDSFEEFEKEAINEAEYGVPQSSTDKTAPSLISKRKSSFAEQRRSEATTAESPVARAPRLSFGQAYQTRPSASTSTESTTVKTSVQTHISSDEYFHRADYSMDRESIRKLHEFDNATAISSDAYFGREPEPPVPDSQEYIDRAKDLALKVAGNADHELDSVKQMIGTGASKLSSYIWR